MNSNQNVKELKLRPHHIYCERFLAWDSSERGPAFNEIKDKISRTIGSGLNMVIEFIEGVDELCYVCPFCQNDRCQSPQGNEDETRKWDTVVLKGLGVSYGDRITAKEFLALIDEKAPLAFCRTRCPYREFCSMFEQTKHSYESSTND